MLITFEADAIKITDPYGRDYTPERHEEIEKLVNGLQLKVERCPQKGEKVELVIANLRMICDVRYIHTAYVEPGNKHVNPKHYGLTYNVILDEIEVLDEYQNP